MELTESLSVRESVGMLALAVEAGHPESTYRLPDGWWTGVVRPTVLRASREPWRILPHLYGHEGHEYGEKIRRRLRIYKARGIPVDVMAEFKHGWDAVLNADDGEYTVEDWRDLIAKYLPTIQKPNSQSGIPKRAIRYINDAAGVSIARAQWMDQYMYDAASDLCDGDPTWFERRDPVKQVRELATSRWDRDGQPGWLGPIPQSSRAYTLAKRAIVAVQADLYTETVTDEKVRERDAVVKVFAEHPYRWVPPTVGA